MVAADRKFDIAILDMHMPGMDGLEAARRIIADYPGDTRPKIIAVTANAMDGDKERFFEAGMSEYVSKPIRVETPVKTLQAGCGNARKETPKVNGIDENKAFDPSALDVLLDTIGGDQKALGELVQSFLDEGPGLVKQIEAGAASGDTEGLRRAAHTMKSSASDFGAGILSATCRDIENHCRAHEMDRTVPLAAKVSGLYRAAETVLRQRTGL